MSELEQLLQHLKQPEYVHVLLNPLPVYATAMGVLALVVALLLRSREAQFVALMILIVGCASVWLVVRYGHRGYDRVYAMSNHDAQQWLVEHADRAEDFQYAFYATAVLAAAAIGALWKFPKAVAPLVRVTLLAAMVCLGIAGWISHAGGQVRHAEFREGPPPGRAGGRQPTH